MSIRNKLVLYFLAIAMLAPVSGGAALARIRDIDRRVQNLSDAAIPRTQQVHELAAVQRDQQSAALMYIVSGQSADNRRYLALTPEFERQLAELDVSSAAGGARGTRQAVAGARSTFTGSGAQLVMARQTRDLNLINLRARHDDIVTELNAIRARFMPSGQSGTDASGVPTALRYQINDLLLGTEGMLHMVAYEQSTASGYSITPDDTLRRQFDSAGNAFNGWLQIAHAAAGAGDRVVLERVQTKYGDFEASGRAMMAAADMSAKSLASFVATSSEVQEALAGYVAFESGELTAVRTDSKNAVNGARHAIIIVTLANFLLAGCLGVWFAGAITRPIRQLRDIADRVSRGDVEDVEIAVTSNDEIADLAEAFRRMVVSVRFLQLTAKDETDHGDDAFDFTSVAVS